MIETQPQPTYTAEQISQAAAILARSGGLKGGKSTSRKKVLAVRKNIAKARRVLAKKRKAAKKLLTGVIT